ncbi:IS110 family transposase [Microbacterium thalassium]|uniref:Transposase n=1 Tax=Microbacterium thalassium TaxID=362649 RepID=A0A7X0FN17_9MICO|nr:IS110 family transposase [Microbacterium thalassium]MBB6390055.1 transposase [Microbacterium thalassium]
MNSLTDLLDVVIGVDTHVLTHTAAIVDAGTGGVIAQLTVDATATGYAELVDFADEHSTLRAWAIEGTGGHGAGLARHLERSREVVVELDRPERAQRRHGAKSDPLDAIRAAREALSRPRLGTPRSPGDRQALSVLLAARRSAVASSTDAQRQVFSLVIAAPEPIRVKFRGMKLPAMLRTAAKLRLSPSWDLETRTTVTVLRSLARRALELTAEAAAHEKEILRIVRTMRPDLLDQPGIGPIVAATVLCAWSHPGRIHSEAAFAMLGGVAPIPATSGQVTHRHRLNRHGDRQLNRALHVIALSRLRYDERTRAYADRRTSQGRSRREIIRCLKRYIARDLYRLLEHPA